jgi:hypothetical protein
MLRANRAVWQDCDPVGSAFLAHLTSVMPTRQDPHPAGRSI